MSRLEKMLSSGWQSRPSDRVPFLITILAFSFASAVSCSSGPKSVSATATASAERAVAEKEAAVLAEKIDLGE